MPTPSYLVQIDVSGTAFGDAPSWTDISTPGYVLAGGDNPPIEITWGRQDETSDPQPSTCTMTLDNADGRFTPDVATLTTGGANPYYPNFDLTTRVRVTTTLGGVPFVRFDGYLTDITVTYLRGGPASLVQIAASDISNRLSSDTPLRSLFEETVIANGAAFLYPLTEPVGSTSAGDITALASPAYPKQSKYGGGSYAFGDPSGVPADGTTGLTFAGTGNQGYTFVIPPGWTASPLFGSVRVAFTTTAAQAQTIYSEIDGNTPGLQVGLDATGKVVATSSSGTTLTSPTSYNDGKTHYVEFRIRAGVGSTSSLLVDGVSVATGLGFPVIVAEDTTMTGYLGSNLGTSQFFAGALAALSRSGLGTDAYAAFSTGLAGETTTAHYTRLLSYRLNTGTNLDVGKGVVGLHSIGGVTLWQALLETSHAEGGVVFVDGQGRVTTRNRATLYNPASALTLDAQAAQVEADLTFKRDSQSVTNDVQVTRPGGAAQRVVNAALKAKHGERVYSGVVDVNSDRDLRDAAGWMLAMLGTPRTKAPQVTVRLDLEPSNAQAQAVLGATVWSAVTITNLPATAPATSTPLLIEGGVDEIGVDAWSVKFVAVAMPPKTLRADASPSANTKLDAGLVIPW